MKIVVIGGTGLIGSKVVEILRAKGHDVLAAAPNTGVDTISGHSVGDALETAGTLVDLANTASIHAQAEMEFALS